MSIHSQLYITSFGRVNHRNKDDTQNAFFFFFFITVFNFFASFNINLYFGLDFHFIEISGDISLIKINNRFDVDRTNYRAHPVVAFVCISTTSALGLTMIESTVRRGRYSGAPIETND